MPSCSCKTSAPSLVVFDSSSSNLNDISALTSWRDGPQKVTGFEKRGRPKKERKKPILSDGRESQMTETLSTFDFVAYTGLPHETASQSRKIIRRRAMLDFREKERLREKKKDVVEDSSRKESLGEHSIQTVWGSSVGKLFLREIVGTDPFDAFEVEIEPYVMDLLFSYSTMVFETQYTIEKYTSVNPVRDCWLPMAFNEPALLHAIIFCAAIVNSMHQNVRESQIAVTHLRQAITIINESLQKPVVSVTDGTVVVVCALAQTEKMNGNHGNWKIHMLGLQQMVQVRGGMKAFDSSPLVQSKIHRADLCGSIDAFEELPHFDPPKYSLVPGSESSTDIHLSSSFAQLDKRLSWILPRIQEVTSCLNLVHLHQTTVHPTTLREAITSLQYALISPKPIGETSIQKIVRLGLTMYLVTILNEFPRGASTFAMLGEKLISTLGKVRLSDTGLEPEFVLWMMFLAASIMDKPEIRGYFLAGAVDAMHVLGASSWEEVEVVFKSFFWAEKIHAASFRDVWREMKC